MVLQKAVLTYILIAISRRQNPQDLVTNRDVKVEGGEKAKNNFQSSGLGNKVDGGAISEEQTKRKEKENLRNN